MLGRVPRWQNIPTSTFAPRLNTPSSVIGNLSRRVPGRIALARSTVPITKGMAVSFTFSARQEIPRAMPVGSVDKSTAVHMKLEERENADI